MIEKQPGELAVRVSAPRILMLTLAATLLLAGTAFAQKPESRFAKVNGTRLHYLIAGHGDTVVLLHGYAETSHIECDR